MFIKHPRGVSQSWGASIHGSFWNPCVESPWLRFCSSRHTCCSEDIWYLLAPTQDGSLALKNKAPVANSKLPWEGHQWLSGVHGQPGSSRGPVKCGQRRGESHKGCGLTMGWAGIRKTLVCSGWTRNKVRGSRWPRGCREDRGRPDTHPGSGGSRGALSWRPCVGSEPLRSLCFSCPRGPLLNQPVIHRGHVFCKSTPQGHHWAAGQD